MERVLIVHTAPAVVGEIALVVGEQLCRAGLAVDVRPVSRAAAPQGYEAVVVGSAVQDGRWARDATQYLTRYAAALAERPLWLYEHLTTLAPPPSTSCSPAPQTPAPVDLRALGADEPVCFGSDDLGAARSWGFGISCVMRPLALPVAR